MAGHLKSLPATVCESPSVDAQAAEVIRERKKAQAAKIVDFSPAVDLSPLNGRGVLVTGGASGFGAAVTEAFARAGAYVTFLDVNEPQAKTLEAKWKGEGLNVQFVRCDVTSWPGQLAAFKAALAFQPEGTLDHVFANAGVVGHFGDVPDEDSFIASSEPEEPKLKQIDVSLTGAFYTVALAIHYLRVKKHKDDNKSIIMTGSMASYAAIPLMADYTAAKYGMRGLMKSYQGPAIAHGIRVNMLAPNYMETSLTASLIGKLEASGAKFGRIEDVVKAVARFACDKSIHARAATADVAGIFDLRDNMEGCYGAIVTEAIYSTGRLPVGLPSPV